MDTNQIAVFRILLGIAMLTMGRRLFWLFLGGIGFASGFYLAEHIMPGQSQEAILVVSLIAGLIGAILAIFLQKLAILVGGFFAGGYLLPVLLKEFGMSAGHDWLLFLIGGVVGAILMKVVFGWTLTILSSIAGSSLILQTMHFGQEVTKLLFVVLVVLGIAIQYGLFRREPALRRKGR